MQLVIGLLLLGIEVVHVSIHLVVGGDVVDAVLTSDETGVRVIDLVVVVAASVVALPEGSVIEVRLTGVHGAEDVQFGILVGLQSISKQQQRSHFSITYSPQLAKLSVFSQLSTVRRDLGLVRRLHVDRLHDGRAHDGRVDVVRVHVGRHLDSRLMLV